MTTDTNPQAREGGQRGHPQPAQARRRPSLAHELPRMPRRYGQWAAAVLFVVVSVLAAGWLWQQKSGRVEVLAVAHAVPAGSVVERADLKIVEVSGVDNAIPASSVTRVEGETASVGLVPGQILSRDMLASRPIPGPGQREVGVELDGTRAPGGLSPGAAVTVVAVPPSGDAGAPDQLDSPTVLADTASVVSVEHIEGAGTRFTLLVPSAVANRVAAYGAAGRLAIVQAPVGGDH